MTEKIGFIGAGNMAEAIIRGIINAKVFDKNDIFISDIDVDRLEQLKNNYGVNAAASSCKLAETVDLIVLSVKPQNMSGVLDKIKSSIQKDSLVISIAAGITINKIADTLGNLAIVRVMPNTPALIGQGAAGVYANEKAQKKIDKVLKIFAALGRAVLVENEDLINAVTAVSGSGPAYFFLMIEKMIKAAVELGLDENTAKQLVTQTAKGAAMMAEAAGETEQSIQQLRQKVTSPGGTTEAAIKTFERNEFTQIVTDAINAAAKRSRELAEN